MPGVHSIPVGAADKIFSTAAAAGVTPEALCRAVGLDPPALKDADNRIPFVLLINLYEHAVRMTGDASFGLHVG